MAKFILGVLWIGGLLVAGSENPYMPWVNVIGLATFAIASIGIAVKFSRNIRNYERRNYLHFK